MTVKEQLLLPTVTPEQMFSHLSCSKRRIILLDYDGTLAPFVVKRDEAFAYPGVYERLDRLMERIDTRVVIITGRSIADLLPLLRVKIIPEIRGSHGWEKRDTSGVITVDSIGSKTDALLEATSVISKLGFDDRLEQKPISVAVHWRGVSTDKVDKIIQQVKPAWDDIANRFGLQVHSFDGGLELRVAGKDKGTAVKEIVSEESTDAFLIYLGDDLTDEDAFSVVRDHGYGVLVRNELRSTKAQLWTKPPLGLLNLLEALS